MTELDVLEQKARLTTSPTEFARRTVEEQVQRMEEALQKVNNDVAKCEISDLLDHTQEFWVAFKTFSCVENRYIKAAVSEDEIAMTRDYVGSMLQDMSKAKEFAKKCKCSL
jgi:phosphoenolpyruvate carboxylase